MTAGAYAIDLRPRHPRRTAPAPLAALALTTLGLHWCLDALSAIAQSARPGASRRAGGALPGLALVVILGAVVLQPLPGLWELPRSLPAAIGALSLPSVSLSPPAAIRPARTEPAPAGPGTAAAAAPPGSLTIPPPADIAPAPAAPAASRSAWQPSTLATAPYAAHIEAWRPLVRELLAEAWQDGRLDGHAARLDDDLVLALIRQESQGDPNALSWAGAMGLMQVMPFTFADMMAGDRALTCAIDPAAMWDVRSNVRAGLRYLALAMNAHEGNLYWALASYNAGIDAVSDWRAAGLYAVPPAGGYWETAEYAQKILRDYLSRRPDVAPRIHLPDPMPQAHVPGALRLLNDLDAQRGGPRPREWIPRCR